MVGSGVWVFLILNISLLLANSFFFLLFTFLVCTLFTFFLFVWRYFWLGGLFWCFIFGSYLHFDHPISLFQFFFIWSFDSPCLDPLILFVYSFNSSSWSFDSLSWFVLNLDSLFWSFDSCSSCSFDSSFLFLVFSCSFFRLFVHASSDKSVTKYTCC